VDHLACTEGETSGIGWGRSEGLKSTCVLTVVVEYKEGACSRRRDDVDALADELVGDEMKRAVQQ
jgi:hypothetical protein